MVEAPSWSGAVFNILSNSIINAGKYHLIFDLESICLAMALFFSITMIANILPMQRKGKMASPDPGIKHH